MAHFYCAICTKRRYFLAVFLEGNYTYSKEKRRYNSSAEAKDAQFASKTVRVRPYGKTGEGRLKEMRAKKKKFKYSSDLPRRMYSFFLSYCDQGAPSFSKFARSIGATLSDIEGFREREEFSRAYTECSEIRRDYLIDNALSRRNDPSFTKFLLSAEYGIEDDAPDDLTVKLEVVR